MHMCRLGTDEAPGSIRWLADRTLQGIIFGCTGMVMSYAMLPAWELCLGWLATCIAWRAIQVVLVVALWKMGVRVFGGWVWDKTADRVRDRRRRKAKAKAQAETATPLELQQGQQVLPAADPARGQGAQGDEAGPSQLAAEGSGSGDQKHKKEKVALNGEEAVEGTLVIHLFEIDNE